MWSWPSNKTTIHNNDVYTGLLEHDSEHNNENGRNARNENARDEHARDENARDEQSVKQKNSPHPLLIAFQQYCQVVGDIPEGFEETLDVYRHSQYFFCQVMCNVLDHGGWGFSLSSGNGHVKKNGVFAYLLLDNYHQKLIVCDSLDRVHVSVMGKKGGGKILWETTLDKNCQIDRKMTQGDCYWRVDLLLNIKKGSRLRPVLRLGSWSQTKANMITDTIYRIVRNSK